MVHVKRTNLENGDQLVVCVVQLCFEIVQNVKLVGSISRHSCPDYFVCRLFIR